MCGILGILCNASSDVYLKDVLTNLKKLEYRGYDSWGYAVPNGTGLIVEKKVGRVIVPESPLKTALAISHTRWATHGGVTDANAHPHTDCKNHIAIVHNGIIENYLELREQLIQKGHHFKSQTDSEVVAHLFEDATGTLLDRAKVVAPTLKGSFSLVIMNSENPEELLAIKNESPLAIGTTDAKTIFASDPLAFLGETTTAIFLNDGDIAYGKRKEGKLTLEFFNYLQDKEVIRPPVTLNWNVKGVTRENYAHYMLKEIMEQPTVMKDAFDLEAAEKIAKEIKGRKVIAIACGTARHSAVVGKHILHKLANFQLEVMMAHEFVYFIDTIPNDTILLAVSQSGETADVMECVRKAKERGIKLISVVNVPSSTLARESDLVFYTNCGPEIAVASTKAFTNQIVAFYLIAGALAHTLSDVTQSLESVISILTSKLPYFDLKAQEIAQSLKDKQHAYMLGKGVNFAIALEGALKLKEISYIHAEGMPAGELKHGTLALIERGTPVILVCPKDYTYSDTINNGLETKARGAYLIGISNVSHPSFHTWLELPTLSEENALFYPLLETIPLQLIAYYTAVLLNRDVDKPRNLAKSCTVK